MHFPVSFKHCIKEATSKSHMLDIPIEDTWKQMEQLVDNGLVKNIGVSNFEISDIQKILEINKKPIAINQFEVHPYYQRKDLVK
jgi:alcohol dehydrogenase (NADP+)/aldehyde reductase